MYTCEEFQKKGHQNANARPYTYPCRLPRTRSPRIHHFSVEAQHDSSATGQGTSSSEQDTQGFWLSNGPQRCTLQSGQTMREMQLLHHHGADRRQELQTILPLVCGDGAAGLSGRMVSEGAVRMGTCGSGASRADVANALTRAREENLLCRQIRSPDRRTSVQPLVQPSHTNLHPFKPTPGHFRPSEENGRFAGMKKTASPFIYWGQRPLPTSC